MNAKEVRIGNYLKQITHSFNGVVRLSAYHFETIEDNEIDVFPIPLTEEWLLDFGFKKNCNNNYQINYNQVCGLSITISDYKSWLCNLSSTTFYELSNCKFVHQLQNLYFALTNEELTIKD